MRRHHRLASGLVGLAIVLLVPERAWPGPQVRIVNVPLSLGIGTETQPIRWQNLIYREPVQDDLKLTDDQKKQLDELRIGISRQFRDNPNPTAEDRSRIIDGGEANMLKVLEPAQRQRLDQIVYQADGPLAFTRPEVVKGLRLNEEQAGAVQTIIAQGVERMKTASSIPIEWGPERRSFSISELEKTMPEELKAYQRRSLQATLAGRDETMKAIAGVLNARQRASYQKTIGEPFDLAKLRNKEIEAPVPAQKKAAAPAKKKRPAKR
jgi:hypothetical protein